ncbi:hypothetical protein FIBSPDRAFT_858564 [Athelia psychrophila]|uniref:Nephrocystin 3-like N-terminal domain-containing protein n=1 Tax=Athelia psychrophila TaxID=1759441 RepID=A0A166LT89_9AGAM|nr:hypothetical protein FIBSPDRAFT_858564 [Fibularhizoctonia sp. CBS 109695]
MFPATESEHSDASTSFVGSLEMQPSATSTFSAKSLDIHLVHELGEKVEFANPDHFAVLSIDGKPVSKPGHKLPMPAPRWPSFNFNVSSTLNISIFRKRRWGKDALVAQYTGQGRDFLDRDAQYELTDERGSPVDLRLSVNVDLLSHSPNHSPAPKEQTFISIGTSGKVTNVGGHFINGDYNVYQEQNVYIEEKIEKWMDAPDTSPNFNAARKKHQPGTGSWFLDGSAFKRWKEEPDILLWLHGGPGCGKTVLCAAAIQKVIDFCDAKASTGYASFFFDGRSAEAALLVHEKLVRSIIMQLAHRCDGMPAALAEMYAKCDQGFLQPPIELAEATLLRIVDSFDDVFIVIDSLDECSERKDVVQWIQSIASRARGKLHMMATSRSEPDIRRGLHSVTGLEDISVVGRVIEADISAFLDAKLAAIDDWNEQGLKELVKKSLLGGSDGMFRWVALQLDGLMECVSREELEQQLKSLPKGLDETYARILSQSVRPKQLKMFLQCLAFSRRAMTVHEIAEVVTVDFDAPGLPAYNNRLRYMDPSKVVNICYGLVTEVDGVVKLAHFSVKEYLISEQILSGAAAKFHTTEALSHSALAQICLAYLLHFDKPDSLSTENLLSLPLARYAAQHWVAHFHSASSDHGNVAALQQLPVLLFEPSPSHVMRNWLCLYDEERPRREVDFKRNDFASPLYYACRSGSHAAVVNLISKGAIVNDEGGSHGSPLRVASLGGYLAIFQLLLEHGANTNAAGGVLTLPSTGFSWHTAPLGQFEEPESFSRTTVPLGQLGKFSLTLPSSS